MGQPAPAPAILLCDGVGCDGYVWKYLQWALAEHYRIIHFHYRGHGRTPLPADLGQLDQLRLSDFAADALAVLDACEYESAILCGHSMGVQVALETWRATPERVAGLILICGSYGNPLRTFKGKETLAELLPLIRATVGRLPWLTSALWKRVIPTDLSYLLAQKLEINGALIRREDFFPYLEGVARLDPRMFVSTLAAAGQHNAGDLLPDIKAPTLILAGRHDSFTPMTLSEKMHELIPQSELHVVEEGSHTAPIERPAEITAVIQDFLRRRVVKGRAAP
jgi:pimeloyl-ACP methyl ester carboxylesterase